METFTRKVRADLTNEMSGRPQAEVTSLNWYILYTRLCLAGKNVLGTRNRIRIWKSAEAIVERIRELRHSVEEGYDLSVVPGLEEKDDDGTSWRSRCAECQLDTSPL